MSRPFGAGQVGRPPGTLTVQIPYADPAALNGSNFGMVDTTRYWNYGRNDGLSPVPAQPMAFLPGPAPPSLLGGFGAAGQQITLLGGTSPMISLLGADAPTLPTFPTTYTALTTDQSTVVSNVLAYIHGARMSGLDWATTRANLVAGGYPADLVDAVGVIAQAHVKKPWYKRWQTYAVAGGVLASGVAGYAIGRHRG